MILRHYTGADGQALAALFRETIYAACRDDYTGEQLTAWAAGADDLALWDRSFQAHIAMVAEDDSGIVGFGDITAAGYLDRLFVRRDRQGRGIGTALCDTLERSVVADCIRADVSVMARPFFQGRGYVVARAQTAVRRGVALVNFRMEKRMITKA